MSEHKVKVLYLDDEEHNLRSFKATFRLKFEVLTALNGEEAKELLAKNPDVSVIITDQRMPNMTGVEFLESILADYPDQPRILLTGYADINAVVDAVNIGKIFHYLRKPWNEEELVETIERAHAEYAKKVHEKEFKASVVRVNEQLEFLLRQRLLS
jgi:response regulator RpfG family c-di-GMP phosphodiesterase